MSIERYKLFYLNDSLIKVVEVTDGTSVRENPITYTPGDAGWSSLLSGIVGCVDSAANLEIIQNCLFDNTTGDFLNMVPFVRYVTIDTVDGDLTFLGDYQFVPTGVIPYTVIGTPVQQAGDDVIATQAYRDVLNGSGSWDLTSHPRTVSVAFSAISGQPTLTDADSNATVLYPSEGEVSFTSTEDGAGLLTGSLSVAASGSDVVSISWVEIST